MKVAITITNPAQRTRRREIADAIVDTGASWTTIPKTLAAELGLEIVGHRRVMTANGTVDVEQSHAMIEYDGHVSFSDIMASSAYPGVLLGALTLEGMALAVDPQSRKLVDSELLLLRAWK